MILNEILLNEILNTLGIFVFITGVCIGSFLNVVALRAFSGESIIFPPSKCPKCGEKIKPYDNIPILSYLILQGKCRNCKLSISMQYPIVEFITGLGFLGFYNYFKPYFLSGEFILGTISLLFFLILFSLAVVISITDIKEKVVFDVHTISLAVIILLFQFFGGNIVNSLIGLVTGAVSMEILSGLGWLLVRKRAFGTGDSYIAASMGALLGAKMFIIAIVVAAIIQVLCIIPSFINKLYKAKEYRALFTSAMFFLLLIFYKTSFFSNSESIVKYIFVILMTIIGFYLCKLILTIKSLKENPTYWPFGPSLLIAMFLVAFYSEIIIHFLSTLM